jgi:hypothetical protein
MPSYFGKDFDRVLRWLKKRVPPFRLITTDRLADEDYETLLGEVYQSQKTNEWIIRITRNLDHILAVETLLHEVSHLVIFDRNGYEYDHRKHHSREWGVVYSDLYRAFDEANEKGEI